jgi:hypothetical protein
MGNPKSNIEIRCDENGAPYTMNTDKRKFLTLATSAVFATMFIGPAPAIAGDGDLKSIQGIQTDAWAVLAGSTLKSTLEGWGRISNTGWSVIWDNPTDYRIRASATFYGSFEDAVGRLVDAVHQSNPELTVTLYRGNKVIHVDALTITNE